jgi:hypothetical protein
MMLLNGEAQIGTSPFKLAAIAGLHSRFAAFIQINLAQPL